MREFGFGLAALLSLLAAPVAALTIHISGVPGAGFVTVGLSGTNTPTGDVTLNAPGSNDFFASDSFEVAEFLVAPLNEFEVAVSGNLTISGGGQSVLIAALFLDNDSGAELDDDFGFRAPTSPNFAAGSELTFSGTGTAGIDITAFQPVFERQATSAPSAFDTDNVFLTIAPVPLPAGAGLMLGGATALGALGWRRRRVAQAPGF